MEKKHISIIGTCVSRNLFNTELLKNIFDIDCYVCQVCMWSMFDKGLNVSKDVIYKINAPEFTTRMIYCELCKKGIEQIDKSNSEYVLIDLHNIYSRVFLAYLGDDTFVYTQNNNHYIIGNYNKMTRVDELKSLHLVEKQFVDIDEMLVFSGLQKLASYLKTKFKEKNIIIHIPKCVETYFNLSNEYFEYDKEYNQKAKKGDKIVCKFSEYFASLLPKAKKLYNINNLSSMFIVDDLTNNNYKTPASNHFTDYDNISTSMELLKLLKINYKDYFNSPVNPYQLEMIKLKNNCVKYEVEKRKKLEELLTLNTYFDRIDNLNDFIVVISAKDDASSKIKYFRNKAKLGISANINFRDSYIAIIDKSRNFVYENNSKDAIDYDYTVDGNTIHVESAGYACGCFSTIKTIVGASESQNYSPNKRGFNIVLFNAKTLEVVDQAYCDCCGDKNLLVKSNYFDNFKITTK